MILWKRLDRIGGQLPQPPADTELQLSIYDNGEYHALVLPCRRDGLGWRDVRANRPMPLKPTHWRRWDHGRE
jgi:hypothetical protein